MIGIRRGLTRTVLLTRRWAIKVPRMASHDDGLAGVLWSLARGVSANLSEREKSDRRGVCPVRWSLAGLVNVYPRCEEVDHEPTEEEYAAIGYLGPTDKGPDNVGYLDGRMVFVDFDESWNDQPPCRHLGPRGSRRRANGRARGPRPR